MIETFIDRFCRAIDILIAIALAVMVLLVFGNVVLRYGFLESPNIPRELESLGGAGVAFDPMQASYFLGRETLVASSVPKMPRWQQALFSVMSRNSVPATEFFRIPSDRVVELGVRVAI